MEFIPILLILNCLKYATGYVYNPDYLVPPKCPPCDAKSCPQLTFCAGKEVKDHCGCCPRCSSDLFQPHVAVVGANNATPTALPAVKEPVVTENPCVKRQCPKFKVCMVNVQGLPICTCPSIFVCKGGGKKDIRDFRDTELCGSDGVTYESRCHMRIANCNSNKRIKRRHSGKCTEEDLQEIKIEKLLPAVISEADNNEKLASGDILGKSNGTGTKKKRRDKKGKKNKNRKKQRKGKKKKNGKKRQRRMKRRNESLQQFFYPPSYEELIGRHTKWSSSQVRKSRI